MTTLKERQDDFNPVWLPPSAKPADKKPEPKPAAPAKPGDKR